MRRTRVAYLLWCTCFLGFAGVHRLYSGKYVSGLVWMLTLGCFGVGQLLDLARIPDMVEEKNLKNMLLYGNSSNQAAINPEVVIELADEVLPTFQEPQAKLEWSDIQTIFHLAQTNSGIVSLVDCVVATGKPASELRRVLEYLCLEGFLAVENHQNTGSFVYKLMFTN